MNLAVATSNPDAVSETYVRQHMRLVRPGATVAIGLSCNGKPELDIPVHCVCQTRRWPFGKLATMATLLRTGYGAALSLAEERHLAAFLKAHEVKAVLAEFGTSGAALRVFCRKAGLPLFVNFHGHDATVLGHRKDIRRSYRLLARDAKRVICGSRHFAGLLEDLGFPAAKIEVIPCGIEMEGFSAQGEKDHNLIIAVGRLTRKKRPDIAIRAFALARKERPSLRLEIIGEGGQRTACEDAIRQLGLESSVTLLGARSHHEVKARLAGAGIFIQHSVTSENGDQESQGISLLEAMASGLPVVTTDHNGFSEAVTHGETGYLSPEGDVEAMADNILRLANDSELARRFGRAGRARIESQFDALHLAGRLRELIFGGGEMGHSSSADSRRESA